MIPDLSQQGGAEPVVQVNTPAVLLDHVSNCRLYTNDAANDQL